MLNLNLKDLLDYTAWERQEWHGWLQGQGDQVLETGVGSHGDGRFDTVGDLITHIFSAEIRYVERLSGQPLTDTATIQTDSIDALFQFGRKSRASLTRFLETFPSKEWHVPQELNILTHVLTTTPRRIVTHVLIHEIRHWAQIATLLRLNGLVAGFHDFLFSPVLGDELTPGPA